MMRTALTSAGGVVALALLLGGCDAKEPAHAVHDEHEHSGSGSGGAGAPSNRVDIPAPVRQNLGITFAKVEYRNVAQTLRVPGRFELLSTARREYRTPMGGRVELLTTQYQRVEAGAPLYRVDSSDWRDLHEKIETARARVDSMAPIREAHRAHERALGETVTLWQERLKQLDELRQAGGGSAAQFTEARAMLTTAQAELGNVMEKDAELASQQKQVEAELRSLQSRHDLLVSQSGCADEHEGATPGTGYTVCAVAGGVVEMIGVTPGGLAEASGLVLTIVQPEQIRFRARGMQSDLGRLRENLSVRIVPAQGGSVPLQDTMTGVLRLGPVADADERTVDLMVTPTNLAWWAKAGVSGHMEITLAGGTEELAIPLSAVVRDGATPIIFRRDPSNPDRAIRIEADVGTSDGRWVVIHSGVREGDEIILGGNYQLMLATSTGAAPKGGHFHPDGTFHEGEH